jgi:hypothetical protein
MLDWDSGPSLEKKLIGRAGVSAPEREAGAYQFGTKRSWAVGRFSGWAASVPRGFLPFSLFFSFSFFFFSFVS